MSAQQADLRSQGLLQRLRREPLVAFFALGLGIFVLHSLRAPPPPEVITLSRSQVLALHTARLGRAPTTEEFTQALERETERKALHREAQRLGLDQADPIIERRLVQKMDLLAEDLSTMRPATDDELQSYLQNHAARFSAPERRDVEHVFVSKSGGTPARKEAIIRSLKAGAEAKPLGEPFAAGRHFRFRTQAELARTLGPRVASAAFEAPAQVWGGPWPSVYGLHWVRTSSVVPAHKPPLKRVRAQVEAEFERRRREQAVLQARKQAVSRYTVVIEP